MIKENKSEFDICGITKWHELGYTGKGIKVANMEQCNPDLWFYRGKVSCPTGHIYDKFANYHGNQTMDVIHQVAPDADLITLSNQNQTINNYISGDIVDVSIPYMIENKVHLVNASLAGQDHKVLNEKIMEAQEHGIVFCTSAGNTHGGKLTGYAKSDKWISVTSLHYDDDKNKINLATYASRGEALDIAMFSNLHIHDARKGYETRTFPVTGTSFSSPMFTGMLALLQQFFLEKAGRTLYQNEVELFIKDHVVDLGDAGHDELYGYGLFVLPNPDDIIISKYLLDGIDVEIEPENLMEIPEPIEGIIEPTIPIQSNPSDIGLIIDCGHGGTDSGALSFGYLEKDLTLVIGKRVRELLKEFNPAITRTNDKTIDPPDRTALIKNKYDYCISIHLNAGKGNGTEAIHSVLSTKGKEMATEIVSKINEYAGLPLRNKPVFSRTLANGQDYYYIHRDTGNTITVIVECLFLDNAENINKLYIEQLSRAIADGFKEFISKQPTNNPTPKPIEKPKEDTELLVYKTYLQKGSKGSEVEKLQIALNSLGYSAGDVDGIFGNLTYNAVTTFQRTYGLVADGIAGKATYSKINEVLSGKVDKTIYRAIRRFNSDIHILVLEPNKYHVDIDLGQRGKLEKVSDIVKNKLNEGKKVIAGINAGFFNFNGSSEHLGMLIDAGLYYTPPNQDFVDFVYFKDGHTEIHNHHGYDKNLLSGYQSSTYWAVGTSYSLVQGGKIDLTNTNRFDHANVKNPRTMIGQKKDGAFILVVVDGRASKSSGLTAKEQAEIMLELGCHNAVNLDGGGSSTMVRVENNKPKIINSPSDVFERAVGSVFVVYEK